jgi:hypothetical protein
MKTINHIEYSCDELNPILIHKEFDLVVLVTHIKDGMIWGFSLNPGQSFQYYAGDLKEEDFKKFDGSVTFKNME